MKKMLSVLLVLSLLFLCGCGSNAAETTAPTETATVPTTAAPTEEPTEAPTEASTEAPTEAPTEPPVPTNPLTGETLEAPLDSRVFAITINNISAAMPMYGVSKADLYFEMFVNDYCTRGLALFADITEVDSVGSVRSLRYNFIDVCQAYDAIVVHASGSEQVLSALRSSGVSNVSAEAEYGNYYFRDQGRLSAGYAFEHTLFVKGAPLKDYAESKGIDVTQDPEKDYGLAFTEDGTPVDGEDAAYITITLNHDGAKKKTIMDYDEELGKYIYNQFGYAMNDGITGDPIGFENVIVMYCTVTNQDVYHVAQLEGSGEGYFACGGKIIPIKWIHENETDPFTFTLTDGTPLELGVGSTYIAFAPMASTVEYE